MGRVCVDYFDLSPSSRGDITSGSSPKSNDRANITGKIKYRRPSATRSSISSIYSGESNTRRSSSHSQYSFGSVFSGVISGARRSVSSGASSVFPGEVKYTFHNVFGNDMGEASHGQQQLRIGESRLNTNGDALDGGVGMHGIDFGVSFTANEMNECEESDTENEGAIFEEEEEEEEEEDDHDDDGSGGDIDLSNSSETIRMYPSLHNGPVPIIYRCKTCYTDICHSSLIISKDFWGNKGNAYFVKNVLNVRESKCETMKNMRTGRYGVKSITCVQCDSEMGWKYITSVDPDERYKVGKYVVERNMMDVYKVMS
ncbi:hypothetical protein CAS74_004819 [Pichia kudriavzevii]|uniref:Yippee domain-containing protein n=1 Tax=Pichia kudriavzevii TaxID=4909 RepID=A0A1Z8JHL4_PICKU|nr:hypothetical protein CAS74_004819 [Pichia kudriavzevii]